MVAPGAGHVLAAEQATAVAAIITSGRCLDVLVGPAGTGKSTTMATVRAAWEADHGVGSVVGLAPSAAAAEVLADAVGVPTENTAKWIAENQRTPERRTALEGYAAQLAGAYPSLATRRLEERAKAEYAAYRRWSLARGQLVIVDEASLAATKDLDHITAHARQVGAKVLLVGDWAQLSPVQAGGAFKLLADDRGPDAPTLHDVHRFAHEWERDASLQLRLGNPDIADTYLAHERVESGAREDMLDLLFDAWRTDTKAGRSSLMLAADTQTVADLNTRARAHRIGTGQVTADGVRIADGTTAGVGDVIVTRLNQRALTTGRGWVKNGDDWIVRQVRDDGSLAWAAPAAGPPWSFPPTTCASTSNSDTPPPPTAPRAAPSTPHTPTCQPAPRANPSTSWPPEDGRPTGSTSTRRTNRMLPARTGNPIEQSRSTYSRRSSPPAPPKSPPPRSDAASISSTMPGDSGNNLAGQNPGTPARAATCSDSRRP